jgi:erythritol kinase
MKTPVLFALDSGTSVVKAVAFDLGGQVIDSVARPNRPSHVAGGGVEQDMKRTWEDAVDVLAALRARVPQATVAALAVTGQGDGTWLMDAEGAPLAPAMLWLDGRAGELVARVRETEAAARVFAHTGSGLNACQQSSQLLWLKTYRPELLARAATVFHCKDWVYFNLTGVRGSDPSEACFTFGDWRHRNYDDEVLAALTLSEYRRLLPPIIDGIHETHGLSVEAARRIGLPAGLPVVLGYVDVVCTALGGGIVGSRAGVSTFGSTGMHLRLATRNEDVRPSAAMTGYCMVFPAPGAVMQAQTNMAATLNIDWLIAIIREAAALAGAGAEGDLLEALNRAAETAKPGALLFHPFISNAGERGPFTDAKARAAILGLDQRRGIGDLARAIFESLGFAARDCYEAMGGVPEEILVTGGAAKSPLMRRILAAILDRPTRSLSQPEAGAAGAAMIAAVAIGAFPSIAACAAQWITPIIGPPTPPDVALASVYRELFPIYQETYRALQPSWQAMAAVREHNTDA